MAVNPIDLAADIVDNIETDTGNSMVPAAGVVWLAVAKGMAPYFSDSGGAAVNEVTAGSSMVSVSPTTGNVVVDVVPSNFPTFTSSDQGVVPASGGGTSNFLRADGSWAAPTAAVSDGDKGDITVSSSGAAWAIDNNAVTLAKLADIASSRVLGRATAGSGDPEELTGTQATALLDSYAGSSKGLVPAGSGTSSNYLSEDGTWSVPATTGILEQVFELADTGTDWTKPTGARFVEVIVIGGGGGGGGGRYAGNGNNRSGGGGGGGACVVRAMFRASELPSAVTVTVAAGGAGGTPGTIPTVGGNGGKSAFGDRLSAYGGGGGAAGVTSGTASGGDGGASQTPATAVTTNWAVGTQGGSGVGSPPIGSEWGGAGGGRAQTGVGQASIGGGYSLYGGAGGGGGGQKDSNNANQSAGFGGVSGTADRDDGVAYRAAAGTSGSDGDPGVNNGPYCGGGGGGGGASSSTNGGVAGNGGNGGIGSGGGGGGAAGNTGATPTGGNGGNGGNGRVIVITYR